MNVTERHSRITGRDYYVVTSDKHPAIEGERSQPEATVQKNAADQAPDLDAYLREAFQQQTGLEA